MKDKLKGIFAFLIIAGLIAATLGLIAEMPKLASTGIAMFIAGFFTPVYFTKTLRSKEALFGGVWLATVLRYAWDSIIDYRFLLLSLPLLLASIVISKWAKTEFKPTKP